MRAAVNGEERVLPDGTTVAALLTALEVGGKRIAVEVNRSVVPKTEYPGHVLRDGDQIEIVHFVGGG